jgi:hypothetical protein
MQREKLSVRIWIFEASGEGRSSSRRVYLLSAGFIALLLAGAWAMSGMLDGGTLTEFLVGRRFWR